MSAKSDRRKLVNAAVVAGSAAMFAAAWTGIVRADTRASTVLEVPATAAVAGVTSSAVTSPAAAQAAPAAQVPPRRVVVVRQSRAS